MTDYYHDRPEVNEFLKDHIDAVPHLEALLLLWNTRPRSWTVDETAKRLFVAPTAAKDILLDLARQRPIVADDPTGEVYRYVPESDRDRLITSVDAIYRLELIRVSRLIYTKPSAAVRDFAQDFRFKKTVNKMGPAVYILGALTSLCCAILPLRGYGRDSYGAVFCFVGLTISNALVFVDLVLFPDVNLFRWKLVSAAAAMILLLYGLIWESE